MIIERGGDVSEEKVKASEQNEDIEKEIKEEMSTFSYLR